MHVLPGSRKSAGALIERERGKDHSKNDWKIARKASLQSLTSQSRVQKLSCLVIFNRLLCAGIRSGSEQPATLTKQIGESPSSRMIGNPCGYVHIHILELEQQFS